MAAGASGGVSKRKQREEKRRAALKAKQRQEKRQASRSYQESQEIAALEAAIAAGAPPQGSNPLSLADTAAPAGPGPAAAAAAGSSSGYAGARTFEQLPLSRATKGALKAASYVNLTAIQRAALPHALAGRDILGAAKTGSGKTLCFIIPLVEKLYRSSWTRLDGLGALVLTPTRELAMQIFEELVKVGKRHDLSAGLLIGGKAVSEEASRVNQMNILVATPGRLLQHMDETPGFEPSGLQLLVLDEADRILDMGFAATLDAILANLPRDGRQTLLFSATQTKSVRDLARLSLSAPEYLAVHSQAAAPTPLKLMQAYMEVGLGDKTDVLWGFIKSHLAAKTIVFLSTCKQVRYVHEAFRKLRPGTPLRCLHGGMKQGKRMAVYEAFNAPTAAGGAGGGGVLFATDIAARGLDFPDVDWVVQADCPEDVAAYIHRVGRTARYTSSGRSLLLLLPSEKPGMLAQLAEAKIPLQQLKHNPAKVSPLGPSLAALLSKSPELKAFAQAALVSYVRSVFLQPNKAVFDAAALPVGEYAESLGLLAAPQLKFLKRVGKKVVSEVVLGAGSSSGAAAGDEQQQQQQQQQGKQKKRKQWEDEEEEPSAGSGDDDEEEQQQQQQQPAAAAAAPAAPAAASSSRKRKQAEPAAPAAAAVVTDDNDNDDDFLTIKQRDVFDVAPDEQQQQEEPPLPAAAAAAAAEAAAAAAAKPKKRKKQRIKLGAVSGQRVVFDESGRQLDPLELLATEGLGGQQQQQQDEGEAEDGSGGGGGGLHVVASAAADRFELAAQMMRQRDRTDKKVLAALRRQAKLEKKIRRKAAAQADGGLVATLGGGEGSDEEDEQAAAAGGSGRSYDGDGSSASGGSDDEQAGRRHKSSSGSRARRDSPSESGGGNSGSDDAAAVPDAAYTGMARKSAAGSNHQPAAKPAAKQQPTVSKQQPPAAAAAAGVPSSLVEQEALALQLLAAQRW